MWGFLLDIFGLTVSRTKAAVAPMTASDWGLTPGRWWPLIRESFTGAWQRNITIDVADVLTSGPVWSCVTLIAGDISKMEPRLIERAGDGVWRPIDNVAYSPFLRKPNHYQNRIAFYQSWMISKLTRGNTYVLKERDGGGAVRAGYVLDPTRVKPLVAPSGSVFYQLSQDSLAGIVPATVVVPARDIIHDLMYPLYHPLVGISPIHAGGLAAVQGLKIRRHSTQFFDNSSMISGVLVAPGQISADTAKRLEDHWNSNYTGTENAGKIAALGDGLKFEPISSTAKDSELSEQLKESALEVCASYHVPAWLAGYGPEPNYNNAEAKYQQYYSQCLQMHIESLELCLDEGLGLSSTLGIEFDLDALIRMDSSAQMEKVTKGVRGGVYTPNEARRQFNLPKIQGGDTVYLQEQDHSLEWLSRRDSLPIEPPAQPLAALPPAADDTDDDLSDDDANKILAVLLTKELAA